MPAAKDHRAALIMSALVGTDVAANKLSAGRSAALEGILSSSHRHVILLGSLNLYIASAAGAKKKIIGCT